MNTQIKGNLRFEAEMGCNGRLVTADELAELIGIGIGAWCGMRQRFRENAATLKFAIWVAKVPGSDNPLAYPLLDEGLFQLLRHTGDGTDYALKDCIDGFGEDAWARRLANEFAKRYLERADPSHRIVCEMFWTALPSLLT